MAALTTARPVAGLRALNPFALARNLWRHHSLIRQLTRREIEGRYRGSFLGILWSLAQPLFMLLVYTVVFGLVFQPHWPQARSDGLGEFALILFCGLTAFGLFAECVGRAPRLVVGVPNYVKKVVFPLEILPLPVLGAALFHTLISLAVLLAAQLLVARSIPWTIVLLPLVLLPAIFLSLGCMWLLASLGVFVRDVGQAIGILVQALFFFTPIFYALEAIPEPLRTLIGYNPLAPVVENARRVILWGQLPSFPELAAWLVVTAGIMMLGYAWFVKTKKAFADVI
jgi:lipopolysaccharide transport system permease protein